MTDLKVYLQGKKTYIMVCVIIVDAVGAYFELWDANTFRVQVEAALGLVASRVGK
mgnify:CR=1 FL=1